ncbi:MAG: TetR/AcrR family transcriptional regulator [Pseudomonadota bacterium]
MTRTRADEILDVAEREMRLGGFDAVSFRDIATAIGIKSASVHYHFPTKAELGRAVVHRYAERFVAALGDPRDPTVPPRARLMRLTDAYDAALRQDGATCLCAVLGAVAPRLPADIAAEIGEFYDMVSDWVHAALKDIDTSPSPELVISLLQGALTLSIATRSGAPLQTARAHIATLV